MRVLLAAIPFVAARRTLLKQRGDPLGYESDAVVNEDAANAHSITSKGVDHTSAGVTDLAFYKYKGLDEEEETIFDVQDDTTLPNLEQCIEAPLMGQKPEFEYFKLCGVNKKLSIFGQHNCMQEGTAQKDRIILGICDTSVPADTCIIVKSSPANAWLVSARSYKVTSCESVHVPLPARDESNWSDDASTAAGEVKQHPVAAVAASALASDPVAAVDDAPQAALGTTVVTHETEGAVVKDTLPDDMWSKLPWVQGTASISMDFLKRPQYRHESKRARAARR